MERRDTGAARLRWSEEADRGVRLFNAHRFFEAHDVFEDIWTGRVGDERLYFQGLIQIAVGFYKIESVNLGGARSLLRKGIDKLGRASHLDSPIDHERLLVASRHVLERLEEMEPVELRGFELASLPEIAYVAPSDAPPGTAPTPSNDPRHGGGYPCVPGRATDRSPRRVS